MSLYRGLEGVEVSLTSNVYRKGIPSLKARGFLSSVSSNRVDRRSGERRKPLVTMALNLTSVHARQTLGSRSAPLALTGGYFNVTTTQSILLILLYLLRLWQGRLFTTLCEVRLTPHYQAEELVAR